MSDPESELLNEIEKGESNRLEFKAALPKDHKQFIKTAVAFSNSSGGRILFGVSDDRQVIGIPDEILYSTKDAITDSIYSSCEPAIIPYVYIMTLKGLNVLVAQFQPGDECPYFIKSEGMTKGTYVRTSGTSVPAKPSILKSLQMRGKGLSFDMLEYPGLELNQADIDSLCTKLSSYKQPISPMLLVNLGVLKEFEGRIVATNAYALLTGNPFLHARTQCARFRDKKGLYFTDSRDYTGDLISQIEGAEEFILKHLNMRSIIEGLVREDVYEIPITAIREAIVNAVLHREYTMVDASIIIRIFDTHVDIESPGLPLGLDLENPYAGRSNIRNQVLASVFKAIGFIERYGTGICRIQNECHLAGLPDPEFYEEGDFFIIRLHRQSPSEPTDPSPLPSVDDAVISLEETIIRMITDGTFQSINKCANQLNVSRSAVQRTLDKLEQNNVIERVGTNRSGQWILKTLDDE